MCGIVAIIDLRARRPIDRDTLVRMNESQHHRGPDEGGLHLAPGVGLGHRRLSIIDLATGQQPLYNEDRSVVVIYNGEIYNYQELIAELTALGYVFRTRSDTEVIVHAWQAWGEQCVDRFRGMFAFVLWDEKQQTAFMARDRLGVKPLYYAVLPDGHLIAGSELKSLLAHGALARDYRSAGGGRILRARLCARAAHDLQQRGQAATGTQPDSPPRSVGTGAARVLGCHIYCVEHVVAEGGFGRVGRATAGKRAAAHDLRSAARSLSVGRCGFERGRRDDGGSFGSAG